MPNPIQPPRSPLVLPDGTISADWYRFFSFLTRDVDYAISMILEGQSRPDQEYVSQVDIDGHVESADSASDQQYDIQSDVITDNYRAEYNHLIDSARDESAQAALSAMYREDNQDSNDGLSELAVSMARTLSDRCAFAAYLSKSSTLNEATSDLGAGWVDLDFVTTVNGTPKRISSESGGKWSFSYPGVYVVSIFGSLEHNNSATARMTYVRIRNDTAGTSAIDVPVATHKNADGTDIAFSTIIEIDEADVGDDFILQVGGGDTYTSVTFYTVGYSIHNAGAWSLPIG